MKLRLSPQTLLVLDAFLEQAEEWKYGYDLSRVTGLKSGTLYPILMRLAGHKLLETEWEAASEPGKPPRHMYRFTPDGLRFARANAPAQASGNLGQVALGLIPSYPVEG
jgi:DNA-binding PadR family transcriptional regulator